LRAKVTFSLADWIQADNAEGAIATARKLRPDAHRCEYGSTSGWSRGSTRTASMSAS